jgi:hypothetical protein
MKSFLTHIHAAQELRIVVPETRQVEGLAAEALSASPAGVSVRTPAGLAELTSTCPATHG